MSMPFFLEEYCRFLDQIGLKPHRFESGLAVPFYGLTNVDSLFINVKYEKGKITLSDYFGLCNTDSPAADRLCIALQERYPHYRIWIEKYTIFEIEIEETFPFTSTDELHRKVVQMARSINDGVVIGNNLLGDNFHR